MSGGLTMRLGDSAGQAREARPKTGEPQGRGGRRQRGGQGRGGARDRQGGTPAPRGAMAAALEEALGKRKR